MAEIPAKVQANAWTGAGPVTGELGAVGGRWGLTKRTSLSLADLSLLRPPAAPDEKDWGHPDIGWGLVLPDRDGMSVADLAKARDAPQSLQALCAARGDAPVLRWRADLRDGYLRRHYSDGRSVDLSVAGSKSGTGRNCIPKYLLIAASPSEIPWRTQYVLNSTSFVGRLDLAGDALDRYVNRLMANWAGAQSNPQAPLVWTVDHGGGDITTLMRAKVAQPVWTRLSGDGDLTGRELIDGANATAARLGERLLARRPGFILTTSHGYTASAPDLATGLGRPVDVNNAIVSQAALGGWSPDGAIWYAHACCSAGADAVSRYDTLFAANDNLGRTLREVAGSAGSVTAPLPRALLSAAAPLRAFIGHVEPTFDWTLQDPTTGEDVSGARVRAFYDNLYQPGATVGWALRQIYKEAGDFLVVYWRRALDGINAGRASDIAEALYWQLVALDRQNMVILGDPTVGLAAF